MNQDTWIEVDGGVTAPRGFRAAAVQAGIKARRPDVALLVSDCDAAIAGVFTTNRIQAAPVRLCRERLAAGLARAVIVNSGNANACTGEPGLRDAQRMVDLTAEVLGIDASRVFVCSTGTIGIPMPMAKVEDGIRRVAMELSDDGGPAAARAIMTTDTVPKEIALEAMIDGVPVRIAGMAKGAGMIEPNMATMLGFLTTDAAVDAGALQACLAEVTEATFNRISIDGDTSTNDTVLLLANGRAGNTVLNERHPQWDLFRAGVRRVAADLAEKIVRDGEGATCFVTVTVQGAESQDDALKAARAVARSLLCKTAWFGGDPNWGRIIAAVGYSGARVEESRVDIRFDDVAAVQGGRLAPGATLDALAAVYAKKTFTITIDLHLGDAEESVQTSDLSYDYVKINASYMT